MSRQKIEVICRLDAGGKQIPIQLIWQGNLFSIHSVGRSWDDAEGHHILILLPDEQVVELLYQPSSGDWYLITFPAPATPI